MNFTGIYHDARKKLGLSCNEYCVADMVSIYAANPENPVPGWCFASRQTMANELGVSKVSMIALVDKCVAAGVLEKNETTGNLRITARFYEAVHLSKQAYQDGKDSLPSVKKVNHIGKESLPTDGKESLPYINKLEIEDLNKAEGDENARQRTEVRQKLIEDEDLEMAVRRFSKEVAIADLVDDFLIVRKITSNLLYPFADLADCKHHFFNWLKMAPRLQKPKTQVHAKAVLPNHWDAPLVSAFGKWLNEKARLGKFLDENGIETLIRQLETARHKHGETAVVERIEESITGSWPSLNLRQMKAPPPGVSAAPVKIKHVDYTQRHIR